MSAVIRVDASTVIGTGHVMRCLTLAAALREREPAVTFLCREHPGNLIEFIQERGFDVVTLSVTESWHAAETKSDYSAWLGADRQIDADETVSAIDRLGGTPDWLVVDHYAIDATWLGRLRTSTKNILVIDDLANRALDCDLLLDQNIVDGFGQRYRDLLPNQCKLLLGPHFALLRPEFAKVRQRAKTIGHPRRVLIYFGGVDLPNQTEKAIAAMSRTSNLSIETEVVIGLSNQRHEQIEAACHRRKHVTLRRHSDDFAWIMAAADLSLGASGTTTWERCAVGLPALVTSLADNQVAIAEEMERLGIGVYLGRAEDTSVEQISDETRKLLSQPKQLAQMRRSAFDLVDGLGAQRVAAAMLEPG